MNWSPQTFKARVQQLPPMPKATARLLEMLEDDNLEDMKQIEKQIITDPILTGRILQIANSSFYGMRQQIVSISQACSILGIHTLKNLVYTMALMARFNQPHDLSVINYRQVWRHSLLTAAIAGSVANGTRINSITAFTAGLFHNLGLLIMDFLYPTALKQQIDQARKNHITLHDATVAMSAPPHQSLAAGVLEVWNFPSSITTPFQAESEPETRRSTQMQHILHLISLAALLANGLGFTYLEGIPLSRPDSNIDEPLNKDLVELGSAIDSGMNQYRDMSQTLL